MLYRSIVKFCVHVFAGVLNISSKHVREVADPVSELLSLLHMIVYLSKVSAAKE